MHHRYAPGKALQQILQDFLEARRALDIGMGDLVKGHRLRGQITLWSYQLIPGPIGKDALQGEGNQAYADDGMMARIKAGGLDIQSGKCQLRKGRVGIWPVGKVEVTKPRVPRRSSTADNVLLPVRLTPWSRATHERRPGAVSG